MSGTDKDYSHTITIKSGQKTSKAIDLLGMELAGFFMPADFTGTKVTLQAAPKASGSGGAYMDVDNGDGSGVVSIPVVKGRYIPIRDMTVIAGLQFIRLVADQNQSADRTFTLALRRI